MNVGSPLVANAQPSELVQPCQGSLHHPPMDAEATPVLGKALGQDRLYPQRPQRAPMRFRVICSVSLNSVWSPAWASSLAPNGRNGFHQGQQLGHIMTISSRQDDGQRDSLGVGDQVVFAPRLTPIGRIGPRFSPRRPPLGWRRYPPRLGTSQSGRLLAVWPETVHEGFARPQLPASLEDDANRSCPSHTPSPGAASPKECRSSGRTRYQSAPEGRSGASGQGSAIAWAPNRPIGPR